VPLIAQSETEFAESMRAARERRAEIHALSKGPKKRYHLTILRGGPEDVEPVQSFNAGSLTWSRKTGRFDPKTGETYTSPGTVIECTEAQFLDAMKQLSRYVVRWDGNGRHPKPYLKGVGMHEEMVSQGAEEPLSDYLVAAEIGAGAELVHGEVVDVKAETEAPRDARDART